VTNFDLDEPQRIYEEHRADLLALLDAEIAALEASPGPFGLSSRAADIVVLAVDADPTVRARASWFASQVTVGPVVAAGNYWRRRSTPINEQLAKP
jgi:hypothetical protein